MKTSTITLESLQHEIEILKARNKRVEAEKAWENSWQRRLSILGLTYILMLLVFFILKNPHPFTNAIIPTLGYLLSTLTFWVLKKQFLKNI